LIAFAWRHPELGDVIVTFSPVAHELARLHGLGLPVEPWWREVLAHELGHLNGHWHGAGRDAHNTDADNLVAALLAMQAGAVHLVALDSNGRFVDLADPAMAGVTAAVLDNIQELDRRAALTAASGEQVRIASPQGRWVTDGLDFVLGEDFDAALARTLAVRGLPAITVIYALDRAHRRIVADRGLFEHRFSQLREFERIVMEQHEQLHWRHPEWSERQAWRLAGHPSGPGRTPPRACSCGRYPGSATSGPSSRSATEAARRWWCCGTPTIGCSWSSTGSAIRRS